MTKALVSKSTNGLIQKFKTWKHGIESKGLGVKQRSNLKMQLLLC